MRSLLQLLFAGGLFFSVVAMRAQPGTVVDVTRGGAVGDGRTLDTAAIQKSIDDCAARGGGFVRFPAGSYLTGTIEIKSGVTLHLDTGATLLGSTNVADYRNVDPFVDGNGHALGYALVVALDATRVGIEGPGTVDGQGPALKAREVPFRIRPFLLRWIRCRDVISGDDALVIKSTSSAHPSADIVATDCDLSSNTNAIKLGTEAIGGFADIEVSRCRVTNTRMSGIALYEVDGADLRHVTISDVTMDGVTLPISIRLGGRLAVFRQGEQARPAPGTLRDVLIRNVTAKRVGMIGMLINGLPGHPIEHLTLEHIRLEVPGGGTADEAKIVLPEKEKAYPEYNLFGKRMPASGIYARHVRGLTLEDVDVTLLAPDARPKMALIDATDAPPPIKVLIVDGFSNHDWRLTTHLIRGVIEPTGLFSVDVSTSPPTQDSPGWDTWRPRFKDYDVVIQNTNDIKNGPSWPREVQDAFVEFVRGGGGVYIFHSAQNAFANWPEYNRIIGLGWRKADYGTAIAVEPGGSLKRYPPGAGRATGHAPNGDVLIHLLGDHPIHAGLPRAWLTPHLEVYYFARGPAENVQVLSYARDPRYGENWPVEWTVAYGQGRAYIATFGHVWKGDIDPESLRCAGVQTMIIRALQWLAKRPVDYPVPADFPTAGRKSIRPPLP